MWPTWTPPPTDPPGAPPPSPSYTAPPFALPEHPPQMPPPPPRGLRPTVSWGGSWRQELRGRPPPCCGGIVITVSPWYPWLRCPGNQRPQLQKEWSAPMSILLSVMFVTFCVVFTLFEARGGHKPRAKCYRMGMRLAQSTCREKVLRRGCEGSQGVLCDGREQDGWLHCVEEGHVRDCRTALRFPGLLCWGSPGIASLPPLEIPPPPGER